MKSYVSQFLFSAHVIEHRPLLELKSYGKHFLQQPANEARSAKCNEPPTWASLQQGHFADGYCNDAGDTSAAEKPDEPRSVIAVADQCCTTVTITEERPSEVTVVEERCAEDTAAEDSCAVDATANESHTEITVAEEHCAEDIVADERCAADVRRVEATVTVTDQSDAEALPTPGTSGKQFQMSQASSAASQPRASRPNDHWNAVAKDYNNQCLVARRGQANDKKKASVLARVFGKRQNRDVRRDETQLLHRWEKTQIECGNLHQDPPYSAVNAARCGAVSGYVELNNNHCQPSNSNANNNNGFVEPGRGAAVNFDKKMPEAVTEPFLLHHQRQKQQNQHRETKLTPNYAGHIAAKYFRKLELADDFHVGICVFRSKRI